jgi:hypothetical protein
MGGTIGAMRTLVGRTLARRMPLMRTQMTRMLVVAGGVAIGLAAAAAPAGADYVFAQMIGHPASGPDSIAEAGSLNDPQSVSLFGGLVAVSDQQGIHIFDNHDSAGTFHFAWGPGPQNSDLQDFMDNGYFGGPLAFDRFGSIWLIDSNNALLEHWTYDDATRGLGFVAARRIGNDCSSCSFGDPGDYFGGIGLTADGQHVFYPNSSPTVGDGAGGVAMHRVSRSGNGGTPEAVWQLGAGNRVENLAVDSQDRVYVTSANQGVRVYGPLGKFLFSVGGIGTARGQYPDAPTGVAVGPRGEVFVGAGRWVFKYTPGGELLYKFGVTGNTDGGFGAVGGIAVDARTDSVYVVDRANDVVDRLVPLRPQTTIGVRPFKISGQKPSEFLYESSDPRATFECRTIAFLQVPPPFKPCPTDPGGGKGQSLLKLTPGLYRFEVRAIGFDLVPDATPASWIFTYDPNPPAITAPTLGLIAGQQIGTSGKAKLQMKWTITDDHTKRRGFQYRLESRSGTSPNNLGSFSDLKDLDRGAPPHFAFKLAPGPRFRQYRVVATNRAGATGTSPNGPTIRLMKDEDSASGVSYTGNGWTAFSDPRFSGGDNHDTGHAGDTATYTFKGVSVGVVLGKVPGSNSAKVCVDNGGCKTVNLNDAATSGRHMVFTASGLSPSGHHTVTVTDLAGALPVDAFLVLG